MNRITNRRKTTLEHIQSEKNKEKREKEERNFTFTAIMYMASIVLGGTFWVLRWDTSIVVYGMIALELFIFIVVINWPIVITNKVKKFRRFIGFWTLIIPLSSLLAIVGFTLYDDRWFVADRKSLLLLFSILAGSFIWKGLYFTKKSDYWMQTLFIIIIISGGIYGMIIQLNDTLSFSQNTKPETYVVTSVEETGNTAFFNYNVEMDNVKNSMVGYYVSVSKKQFNQIHVGELYTFEIRSGKFGIKYIVNAEEQFSKQLE